MPGIYRDVYPHNATVHRSLFAWGDAGTYVEVTETGFLGDGDQLAASAAGSTDGFSIALCALKALLERDITLTAVLDRFPADIDT